MNNYSRFRDLTERQMSYLNSKENLLELISIMLTQVISEKYLLIMQIKMISQNYNLED
jgi:hypothetical protein